MSLVDGGHLRTELPRVAASSECAASTLINDPQALAWLRECQDPIECPRRQREYERLASGALR